MTEEEFEEIVDEALSDLPAEIAEKLENVGVVIEDSPSEEQRSSVGIGRGGTLLALYQGVPRSRRGHRYSLVLPDRITIFRLNVLAAAEVRRGPGQSKTAAVRDEVRRAVFHEIGHHFGLSEADLRRLGY